MVWGEQRFWVVGMTLETMVNVKKVYIVVFNVISDIVIVHNSPSTDPIQVLLD